MAKKKPPAATTPVAPGPDLVALLGAAVQALQTGQPYMAPKEAMAQLIAHPTLGQLVEYSDQIKDAAGNIAFRATARGGEVLAQGLLNTAPAAPAVPQAPGFGPPPGWGNPPGVTANVPAAPPQFGAPPAAAFGGGNVPGAVVGGPGSGPPAGNFKFNDGVPIPTARRGGRGQIGYGFEHMGVGQSFDIPATSDNPNPAKRIASTVSSASKRLSPKAFTVRSVPSATPGAPNVARIWRTA